MSRIPNPQLSRAVLIGTSDYERTDQLPNLPAVRNNLSGLERTLTDPLTGIFLPQYCSVVDSPDSPRSMMRRLTKTADSAEDVLLVYYAGHGTLDRNGDLHLTVRETDPDPYRIEGTAVPFIWIRRVIEDSPARVRVLILDCCFSGRAIGAMSHSSAAFQQIQIDGTYILTSSEANKVSLAVPGERYTAFTGELLALLSGPPTDPAITLSELNRRLRAALARRDLPAPRCRADSTSGDLILRREVQPAAGAPAPSAATVVPKPLPETPLPLQQPPLTRAAEQPKSKRRKHGLAWLWLRRGGRKVLDAVPTTLSPKAIASAVVGTAAVTVLVLSPVATMLSGLWNNDSKNPSDAVEGESPDSGNAARRKNTTPSRANFTDFRNEEAGIALSYPSSWTVLKSSDPDVILLSSDGPQNSFLLRAAELPSPVGQQELADARQLTDQIVGTNQATKMLTEPKQIELGGLPGYWYLYTFEDETSGTPGTHSHYFLFKGKKMITLVFQTVPSEKFEEAAPIFDQITNSLLVLE